MRVAFFSFVPNISGYSKTVVIPPQNSAQQTADFLSEVLDVVTTIDNTVLSFGENAIEKKFNLLTTLIQLITGTSSGK